MSETITGLSLLVALASLMLVWCAIAIFGAIWRRALWMKTHEKTPEAGQVWNQRGGRLFVVAVTKTDNDTIVKLRSYAGQERNEWDESLSAWKVRVEEKKLYLMKNETEKFRQSLAKGETK